MSCSQLLRRVLQTEAAFLLEAVGAVMKEALEESYDESEGTTLQALKLMTKLVEARPALATGPTVREHLGKHQAIYQVKRQTTPEAGHGTCLNVYRQLQSIRPGSATFGKHLWS